MYLRKYVITHPSQEYLKSRFDYDPLTGSLIWKQTGLVQSELEALTAYEQHGTEDKASASLGIGKGAFVHRLRSARVHRHLGVSNPLITHKRLPCTLVGKPAGCLSYGYVVVSLDGTHYYAHRLIWMLHYGEWINEIDHIDRNKANNRLENLRPATRSQNNMNAKLRRDNQSGCKGVYLRKDTNKWTAEVKSGGTRLRLGCYATKEEAQAARIGAAKLLHGPFMRIA